MARNLFNQPTHRATGAIGALLGDDIVAVRVMLVLGRVFRLDGRRGEGGARADPAVENGGRTEDNQTGVGMRGDRDEGARIAMGRSWAWSWVARFRRRARATPPKRYHSLVQSPVKAPASAASARPFRRGPPTRLRWTMLGTTAARRRYN